jgi:formylglycine-generating enzyme required for sulfatase activity
MVSSTFTDLQEHRAALIESILGHKLNANVMEYDSAMLVDVIDSSLQMVRDSSAFIGLISHKYGQAPECPNRNPYKLSITELEFNETQRLGRPTLLFIMGEDHPVKKADIETDPEKKKKLDALRERAMKASPGSSVNRVYAVFNSVEEFKDKLGAALAELSKCLDYDAGETDTASVTATMAAKIFISYRRDDGAGYAGRVHDRLEREFGRDLLFMDVDAIPLGVNFVTVLEEEVTKCDVLLAIIGSGWLDARDDDGKRRLDNPHDYIRIEIAAALKRGIPVIPILMEGTRVPKADQLPDDLKDLVLRNGLDVRHASFHNDMDILVCSLRGRESAQQPTPATPTVMDRMCVEGRIKVDAKIVQGALDGWFLPGNGKVEWFQDYEGAPEMVVVPAGSFTMGSPTNEKERGDDEGPQHLVTFSRPFAVGKFAVTFDEWDACVADNECRGYKPSDRGWGRSRRPVINVSWDDANAFVAWLSGKTGKPYRLPSEAEREYVTRAGTTTPFWWVKSISPQQANYNGTYSYGNGPKGEYRQRTLPVDSFGQNPWGLYQVHGNVWEWTADCYNSSYNGAPADGSAWTDGDCRRRVVRDGAWDNDPRYLRSAQRVRYSTGTSENFLGFRVARTLTP